MSAAQNKGLGKGLGALLPVANLDRDDIKDAIVELKINDINPNADQPRKAFDQSKLEDLANSIRENGVIQPIIVCRAQPGYKIVTGERRWRASRMAGLTVIPAIIRELTDVQVLEQALIENIQRQDLNPLEEAYALEKLIKDHALTQEKLATVIGRSRPAIANTLRLLNLPDDLKQYLLNEELTAGHARALLSLNDTALQKKAADLVRSRELSVRETEKLVKKMSAPPKPVKAVNPAYVLSIKEVERRLTNILGTRVKLRDRQGKGTIQISYYSNEELDRLLDLLSHSRV
jgi:ParB family chromosome partitioning protein